MCNAFVQARDIIPPLSASATARLPRLHPTLARDTRRARVTDSLGVVLFSDLLHSAVTTDEITMFAQVLPDGSTGTMDHFWMTPASAAVQVSYYVDGES